MNAHIVVSSPIVETPRVLQVRGMFDLTAEKTSQLAWDVHLPIEQQPWHLGLIVGPSGCGKSTVARKLWPQAKEPNFAWSKDRSILDGFPESMPIKEVVELLSSVGFSSPPAWLRPFPVLSTGQQFRVTLARCAAEAMASPTPTPIVFDEYTSVVDRTVAKVGSAALARTIRNHRLQFIAVTCHEDVQDWLQPDWIFRPAEMHFAWRSLQRRPLIELEIVRCQASAWTLFAPHHYLSHKLTPSAVCFLAEWLGQPVAFSAWLPFVGSGPKARREHRTVCLPDFQGVGIGNAVSDTIAGMWSALGYRALSTTSHPAMIRSRIRSKHWMLTRKPSLASSNDVRIRHAVTRLTAGFRYIGPKMESRRALALVGA